jgi:hypothetical protein
MVVETQGTAVIVAIPAHFETPANQITGNGQSMQCYVMSRKVLGRIMLDSKFSPARLLSFILLIQPLL